MLKPWDQLSAQGGPPGTPNEVAFFNGINEMPVDVQMKWYDVWGTEETYNHMSAGWSWAFDTPFDWFKQNASRHKTQYFEMMGQWALYDQGWLLSTRVNRAPWQAFGAANPDPLNNQTFQLYNLNEDFTQANDIADKHPEKVKELRRKFEAEARKHQVFPLDASVAARIVAPRPNITAGRTEFDYTSPMVGTPQGDSPFLRNSS